MVDVRDYVVAAILSHISENGDSTLVKPLNGVGAARALKTIYGSLLRTELVTASLEQLITYGVATKTVDRFTSDFYALDENKCDELFARLAKAKDSPFEKASKNAAPWVKEALASLTKLSEDDEETRTVFIPASDRLVKISDNHDLYVEIDDLINENLKILESDNEVGDKIADDRGRIAAELRSGRELVKGPSVRLLALFEVLIKPLRYIVEKFSGGALGEAAKKLIDLLFEAMKP